jgi:hypothetical protein
MRQLQNAIVEPKWYSRDLVDIPYDPADLWFSKAATHRGWGTRAIRALRSVSEPSAGCRR